MPLIHPLPNAAFIALSRYGVISVSGEDALSFIHGQLTHNIADLKANEAAFAGYCTHEGLLFALMLVWKDKKEIYLMLPKTVIPSLITRLNRYILRAKVALTDQSDKWLFYGIAGQKAKEHLLSFQLEVPRQTFEMTPQKAGFLIKVKDAFDLPRFLWIVPKSKAVNLSFSNLEQNEALWEFMDIDAQMPKIDLLTQNRFMPPMLNMDKINAMPMQKACFPGKEQITKAQNQSENQKQMLRAYIDIKANPDIIDAALLPGMPLFTPGKNPLPCGNILRAVQYRPNHIDCLVVVSHNLKLSDFHLNTPDGPVLHNLSLSMNKESLPCA